MLNEKYIIELIELHLNSVGALSESDFNKLFSNLSLIEQYKIIDIMIDKGIELVDDLEEFVKIPEEKTINSYTVENDNFHQLMKLTNEQLCVMAQKGKEKAVTALLEKNKGLVYSLALKESKKYYQSVLTVHDLFQEGCIGLLTAINRFDISLDNKFVTYSWHWIRQKIVRIIVNEGYFIRLPVHLFDKVMKFNSFRRKNPCYSIRELALNWSEKVSPIEEKDVKYLIELSEYYLNTISINEIVGENEDSEIIEFISDENMHSPETIFYEKYLIDEVNCALGILNEKELMVLRLRFGLEDGNEWTLQEIGEKLGITRERIRQIQNSAFTKLRKHDSLLRLFF